MKVNELNISKTGQMFSYLYNLQGYAQKSVDASNS